MAWPWLWRTLVHAVTQAAAPAPAPPAQTSSIWCICHATTLRTGCLLGLFFRLAATCNGAAVVTCNAAAVVTSNAAAGVTSSAAAGATAASTAAVSIAAAHTAVPRGEL